MPKWMAAATCGWLVMLGCAAGPRPVPSVAVSDAAHVVFPSLDQDLTQRAATTLDGWLLRPEGPGPFPAIVALHGCAGLFRSGGKLAPRDLDWARRLVAAGFVVLLPDSFSPRGFTEICSVHPQPIRSGYERPRDAYGALQYLQTLSYVQPDRIGLLGWSNGAMTVLAAISARTRARPPQLRDDFKAAIAFYPGCEPSLERTDWFPPIVPPHVLIGALDDWTPASECEALARKGQALASPFELVVYPGAYHDFDDPQMAVHVRGQVATTASGTATIGANPAARADARERVMGILQRELAGPR
jgi:dienelactone hydrolase